MISPADGAAMRATPIGLMLVLAIAALAPLAGATTDLTPACKFAPGRPLYHGELDDFPEPHLREQFRAMGYDLADLRAYCRDQLRSGWP